MKFYQVDAFANEPYKGNPAAICFPEKSYEESELIEIAMEMNLSETAFLWLETDGSYNLRWFTPTTEVDLCGHATLAAAHVLWSEAIVDKTKAIHFNTLSGLLIASYNDAWIELDFPKGKLVSTSGDDVIAEAFPKAIEMACDEIAYVIELESEEAVLSYQPNFEHLKKAEREEIIITSRSKNPKYDFVSRFFGPSIGVDEDPATGSAHCYLAPYWSEKLKKSSLIGYQMSKRTGVLKCNVTNDRVLLNGKAITILEGVFRV